MQQIFEFGDTKEQERIMYKTWTEFRNALAMRKFSYRDVDDALNETFLRVFNDMFEVNDQKKRFSKSIKELREMGVYLVRGARLKDDKPVNYDRFMPKGEFINEDNRFSPKGVEWLYLALSDNIDTAEKCTVKECRAESGSHFGICQFEFDSRYDALNLVDLTIANEKGYEDINGGLEIFGQLSMQQAVDMSFRIGRPVKLDEGKIKEVIKAWATNLYAKIMASCIFEPVATMDKELMYAPFQCLAYYFLKCGFSGIIYESTVFPEAKDIVLFDKKYAKPFGDIKYQVVSLDSNI